MKTAALQSLAALAMFSAGACETSGAKMLAAEATWTDATLDKEDIDAGLVASGRQLVVRECASCHAIDRNTASPRSGAPPMKNILDRYDPEMLTEDLIEGIRVGHDDMPVFDLNVIAADAVVAYLKSISKDDGAPHASGRKP